MAGFTILLGQRHVALLDAPSRKINTVRSEANGQQLYQFTLDRGMIYLEADLEGARGEYVLDTGAPGLVINERPERAHEAYVAQSCAEEVKVGMRQVEHFSLGELELREFEAITLDLNHLSQAHNKKVAGLIGYEILQEHTLLLDYQEQQMHLLDYSVNDALHQPTVRIPFILDGHLPVLELKVGQHTLRLGIDTGSASNILDESWQDLLALGVATMPKEEIQGLDQRVQQVEATLVEDFPVGHLGIDTKFLLLDLSHLRAGAEVPLDGLLGYSFLANFKVAIDYPNQEVLLWPVDLEQ